MKQSTCCNAPIKVAGEGSTHWYACARCERPAECELDSPSTSQTPRTDKAIQDSNGQWSYALADCARQLERELTDAQADVLDLIQRNRTLEHYIQSLELHTLRLAPQPDGGRDSK